MLAFWTPLMHTDRIWTVGVSKGRVMGVACKGENRFPSTLPRPVLTATKLTLPLIQTGTATGQLEEIVVRTSMEVSQRGFREAADLSLGASEAEEKKFRDETITTIDKSNLRLMQAACKKDKSARALDVAARLVHGRSLEIAIKLAQSQNLHELAQRLDILRRAHDCILSDDEESEEEEEDVSDEENADGEKAFSKATAKSVASKKRKKGKKGAKKEVCFYLPLHFKRILLTILTCPPHILTFKNSSIDEGSEEGGVVAGEARRQGSGLEAQARQRLARRYRALAQRGAAHRGGRDDVRRRRHRDFVEARDAGDAGEEEEEDSDKEAGARRGRPCGGGGRSRERR